MRSDNSYCNYAHAHPIEYCSFYFQYAAFLSIVFVVEVGACISGYAYRSKLGKSFERGLNASLSVYNHDYQRTSAINTLQTTVA